MSTWFSDDCVSRPDDLIITKPQALKQGDVVVNWKGLSAPARQPCLITRVRIRSGTNPTSSPIKITIEKPDGAGRLKEIHLVDMAKWGGPYRIRSRTAPGAGSTVQHVGPRKISTGLAKPKKIDEFPHTCTRCGGAAYVGLFEIAHRDEAATAACVARRK